MNAKKLSSALPLKSACAAALVTCWGGAPNEASAITGPQVSDFALDTNLSVALDNVHLVYGVNTSGISFGQTVFIGSIATGPQSLTIELTSDITASEWYPLHFPDRVSWGLIGTYGETGIGLSATTGFADFLPEDATWNDYFGDTDKANVYASLSGEDDGTAQSVLNQLFWATWIYGDNPGVVLNFSEITPNGTVSLTPVPEPSAFALLLGLGALSAVGARRRGVR